MATTPDRDWAQERQASHDAMRRGLVERMAEGRTDLAPNGVMEIPKAEYICPERHKREREAFLKLPILACLTNDIPNPGDKLLFDALGPEIVVLRDEDHQVRAYLNTCPHRGARVVTECDSRKRMTCRFHGWTFNLKGKLIGLPGKEGFADLDTEERGLIPVPVAEWAGMIFVRGDANGEPIDVKAWLGSFAEEIAHLELDKARPAKHSRLETKSNWKLAWDTYCESYHFATLHATTVAPRLVTNIMALNEFGKHSRLGFPRKDWKDLADKPETEWPANDYGGNYFIYPNINMNVSAGPNGEMFYGFYHLYPGAEPGQTVTRMVTYRPGHANGEHPDSDWVQLHDFIQQVVTEEDYSVSEESYRNLTHAPEGFTSVLGANEVLVQKWHRDWNETLEELGLGEK